MATLPQAVDYGPRVKLSSSRVDIPGQGELAVADALGRAASTFSNMMIEHKNKDDALSYASAKNDYMIADIQEREKLKDDPDFDTHDERYRAAMSGHYARLFPTVRSQRDQHLFDAEASLMNERGSVSVGENVRTRTIDRDVAKFRTDGVALQGVIMAANDAATARDAMFSYLENANALRDKGFITDTEHQNETQAFVTDTAFSRLSAMEPKDREVLLERSILMARTQGEPITRDQIRDGKGSDSIADFLPLDTRVKMLEATRKGNEHDETMDRAYELYYGALSRYKDPAKLDAALVELGMDESSDVKTALSALSTSYQTKTARLDASKREDIMLAADEYLAKGQNPENMLGDDWGLLLNNQKAALKADYLSRLQGDGFGQIDRMYAPGGRDPADNHVIGEDGQVMLGTADLQPDYAYWKSLTPQEQANVNLDQATWRQAFTMKTHRLLMDQQEALKKVLAAGKTPALSAGLTPMQHVNAALVPMGIIPQTGRTDKDNEIYWTTVKNLDQAIIDAEKVKGSKLTNDEEIKVLSGLLQAEAYSDSYYDGKYWPGGPSTNEKDKTSIAMAPPETLDKMREPLTADQMTVVSGTPMTHRQKLEALADKYSNPNVSEYNLERANFAMINLIGTGGRRYNLYTITAQEMLDVDAEIKRRLQTK